MLFRKLKGVNHPQHLVDIAAKRQVVYDLMPDIALAVDKERATQSDRIAGQDVVIARDTLGKVRHERVLYVSDSALLDRRVLPGEMGEVGIDRATDDLDAFLRELSQTVIESDDLGGTYKGEIQRIKEEDHVFAAIVRQLEVLIDAVIRHDGGSREVGCRMCYKYAHNINLRIIEGVRKPTYILPVNYSKTINNPNLGVYPFQTSRECLRNAVLPGGSGSPDAYTIAESDKQRTRIYNRNNGKNFLAHRQCNRHTEYDRVIGPGYPAGAGFGGSVMGSKRSAEDFDKLLRPHMGHLYRIAYRFTGSQADAEDLLQDLLIKIYQRPTDLDGVERIRPWLTRVMYRMFIDNRRRYARSPIHLAVDNTNEDGDQLYESIPCEAPIPEEQRSREDQSKMLARALDRLSEDHRLVVMMHDVEGFTLEEISTVLESPIGTLKSRIHRARARLRDLIGELPL